MYCLTSHSVLEQTPHFFLVVPSAAPKDITGHNTSSTSLHVTWHQIPEQHQNGILLSYVAVYVKAVTSQERYRQDMIYKPPGECAANESVFTLEINNLEKYTNYCIQVLGVTSKGFGKISDCIYGITDEDGEILTSAVFFFFLL